MKIVTTRVKAKELNEGDLFSTAGELYWMSVERNDKHSVGEKVYIRTSEPCPPGQEEEEVYKIIIT
jgi:hypothetical protein